MSLRVVILALAATAALPTGAAAAGRGPAPVPGLYRVVFTGSATYEHTYTSQEGAIAASADLHWRAVYPSVRITSARRLDVPAGGGRPDGRASTLAGTWSVSGDGDAPCRAGGSLALTHPVPLAVRSSPAVHGRYVLHAVAAAAIATVPPGVADCSAAPAPDFWTDWPAADGVGAQAPALSVSLPLAPGGRRTRTFHVVAGDPETPPADCGTQAPQHVSCEVDYDWSGTVTLTRLPPPRRG